MWLRMGVEGWRSGVGCRGRGSRGVGGTGPGSEFGEQGTEVGDRRSGESGVEGRESKGFEALNHLGQAMLA
jgi:hypothetical protein